MSSEPVSAEGHLRSSLRDLAWNRHLALQLPSLHELTLLREHLERKCATVEAASLPADVVSESYAALVAVRDRRTTLAALSPRELRWVPFALFYPPAEPSQWLAADGQIVDEFIRLIDGTRNKRALARLLRAFVLNYAPTLPTHDVLRVGIQRLLDDFDSPRIAERRAWACEHHVLHEDGPRAFAAGWARKPISLSERLGRFGGDGALALSRFVREVELVVCEDVMGIGQNLTEEQFLGAVNGLSAKTDAGPRFRDPSIGSRFVNAVLHSFISGRPPDRLRTAVRQGFVDRLGDPRMPSSSGAWTGVSDVALSVFRRWLVDDTLRVFFEVISEAARKGYDHTSNWSARRQFWSAYLDHITDAWVALSPAAETVTRENPAFRDIPHGRMVKAGSNSVLIMTIEGLLLVEFSHSGGVRFWPGQNSAQEEEERKGPELFKGEYRILDFSPRPGHNIPHQDRWQDRVSKLIRDETGVRGSH